MPLNDLLAERGFDIRLSPFNGIGVVSILDMLVKWLVPGTDSTVVASNRRAYQGFELKQGVDFFRVWSDSSPLIQLHTQSGDSLWIMEQPAAPEDALDLFFITLDLIRANRQPQRSYEGVIIPEVAVDIQADLAWLLGLNQIFPGGEIFAIMQALQQIRFRANKFEAHAEVATAIALESYALNEPKPYMITKPFVAFFTQKSAPDVPLSMLWIDFDSWRRMGHTLRSA